MKKIFVLFISVLICISFSVNSFAESTVLICANETKLIKDDVTLIPVEIKNNNGIMGFKVTVTYQSEDIKIVSVSRGTVTKKGNFNTNFGATEGKFDVLWNETENFSEDGTLFVIGVKALRCFSNKSISLSYSQEDTFDEAWKDVKLDCKSIMVSCNKNEQTTVISESTTTERNADTDNIEIAQPSNDQMIDAVKVTLEQFKADSFDDIDDETKTDFIGSLNENISKISGISGAMFDNFKEAKRYYNNSFEENFIEKTNTLIDEGKIKAAIENVLDEFKVKNISDIDENKQEKFVKKVEENLKSINENVPDLTKDIDNDTAMTAVKKLYGSLKLIDASEDYIPPKNNVLPIVCCAAVVVVIVAVATIIVIKKKKGVR